MQHTVFGQNFKHFHRTLYKYIQDDGIMYPSHNAMFITAILILGVIYGNCPIAEVTDSARLCK